MRMWDGFIWLRIWLSRGELCEYWLKPSSVVERLLATQDEFRSLGLAQFIQTPYLGRKGSYL
jgi:hypothetical protein